MQAKQDKYYCLVFALFAKVSSTCDPAPGFDAVASIVEQGTRLDKHTRQISEAAFLESQSSPRVVADIARELYTNYNKHPQILAKAMFGLLSMCAKANTIPKMQDVQLMTVAKELGFSADVYQTIRSHFVQGEVSVEVKLESKVGESEHSLLTVLGCAPGTSNIDVRRAYRRLALTHHPDLYQSYGLEPEVEQDIRQQFAIIQQAYESFKKIRNIR